MNKYVFLIFFMSGCSTVPPQALQKLDRTVGQAIIVHPVKKDSIQAQLSAWQRRPQGWDRVYQVSAVIGRNSLAAPGEKKEGDGKTPSGVYPLGPAFGYGPSVDTGLAYRQASTQDFWVDDPRSMQYNQWVHGTPTANSFERMKRADDLYRYGVVIGYNTQSPIPGAGSAIFMHIWRNYNKPTAGCVALNQRHLRRILRWLNQEAKPVMILE